MVAMSKRSERWEQRNMVMQQQRDREVARQNLTTSATHVAEAEMAISAAFAKFGDAARKAAEEMVRAGHRMEIDNLKRRMKEYRQEQDHLAVLLGVLAREYRSLTGQWPVLTDEVKSAQDPAKTKIHFYAATSTTVVWHENGAQDPPSIFPDWSSTAE